MRATTTRSLMNTAAVGAAALLLLTGCSGTSTASGTYYGQTGKSGDPAIITVDGDTVTWGEFTCNSVGEIDVEDSGTSIGTLDKTRTTVAWTQEGNYYNTDPFTESEDGSVITMSGGTYSKSGTDAGDAILAEREQDCAEQAESKKKREAAKAEQATADEKLKPAIDNVLTALFAAAESGDFSDVQNVLDDNGITIDEFDEYLARNYNGLSADDFFSALQNSPAEAEALLEEMKG